MNFLESIGQNKGPLQTEEHHETLIYHSIPKKGQALLLALNQTLYPVLEPLKSPKETSFLNPFVNEVKGLKPFCYL